MTGTVERNVNAVALSAMYTLDKGEFHINKASAGERNRITNTGGSQFTLGCNQTLGKQTTTSTIYTRVKNQSGANYTPVRIFAVPAGGQDILSFRVGLRYNF